jgi:hypothetical protein
VGLVQKRANEGKSNATWQLSPGEVATRFATDVLGWSAVTVVSTVGAPDGSAVVTIGQTCSVVSADGQPVPSPADCVLTTHEITLAQPVVLGSGGIWEIVEVHPTSAMEFDLGVPPGQTLRAGQTLTFDFADVPPGVLGLTAFIGCGTPLLHVSGTIMVDPNHSIGTLELPATFISVGEGCVSGAPNGYLYAWSGMPPKQGESGDPFSAASAIGEISIVPVSLSNTNGG